MRQFSLGEYVKLDGPILGQQVSGSVRDAWEEDGRSFVRLYNYAAREERTYRIDTRGIARRCDLHELADVAASPDVDSTDWRGLPGVHRLSRGGAVGEAWWLIGALALFALLLPLLTAAVDHHHSARLSYAQFLSAEMDLPTLVRTVSSRIAYDRDVEEYWSAPQDVWRAQNGDCEDYAMVISTYLSAHGVEHGVYGFSLDEGLSGHVAVIARTDDARVLLDPTRATAGTGVRVFRADAGQNPPSPADIIGRYAALPARSYDTPPSPGRPPVSEFVE